MEKRGSDGKMGGGGNDLVGLFPTQSFPSQNGCSQACCFDLKALELANSMVYHTDKTRWFHLPFQQIILEKPTNGKWQINTRSSRFLLFPPYTVEFFESYVTCREIFILRRGALDRPSRPSHWTPIFPLYPQLEPGILSLIICMPFTVVVDAMWNKSGNVLRLKNFLSAFFLQTKL